MRLGVGGERCEVAGHARAPPVAHLAHPAAAAGLPALLLAAVDDDRHVGVVLVVAGELLVELVGEGFRNDAVDHGGDASHWTRRTAFVHPSSSLDRYARWRPPRSSAAALATFSSSERSDSSSPCASRRTPPASSERSIS